MGFDGVRNSLESNRESPVAEFLEHSVATRSGVRFNTGCLHEFSHSSSRVETCSLSSYRFCIECANGCPRGVLWYLLEIVLNHQ